MHSYAKPKFIKGVLVCNREASMFIAPKEKEFLGHALKVKLVQLLDPKWTNGRVTLFHLNML